jgi:hypothetical protein
MLTTARSASFAAAPAAANSVQATALLDIHRTGAWVVIVANGVVGLWALAAHQFHAARVQALWWAIGIAQVGVCVQVLLGVAAVDQLGIELPQFHAFYGFVAIIAIAIIYSYRSAMRHRLYLLYGFGSLFIMGLGLRAIHIGAAR